MALRLFLLLLQLLLQRAGAVCVCVLEGEVGRECVLQAEAGREARR